MFQFVGEGAYRRRMAVREIPLFALVSVLWGIPYLLIAVALTGFDATFVAWARVALAAVVYHNVFSIIGAHFLGMYALVIVVGDVVDRIGRAQSLSGGLLLMGLSVSCLLWAESVHATAATLTLLGGLALTGAGVAALAIGAAALVVVPALWILRAGSVQAGLEAAR